MLTRLNVVYVSTRYAGRCKFFKNVKLAMDDKVINMLEWSEIVTSSSYKVWLLNLAASFMN